MIYMLIGFIIFSLVKATSGPIFLCLSSIAACIAIETNDYSNKIWFHGNTMYGFILP